MGAIAQAEPERSGRAAGTGDKARKGKNKGGQEGFVYGRRSGLRRCEPARRCGPCTACMRACMVVEARARPTAVPRARGVVCASAPLWIAGCARPARSGACAAMRFPYMAWHGAERAKLACANQQNGRLGNANEGVFRSFCILRF